MATLQDRRLGEIDGLRCVAMAAVVAIHTGILPFGWMGVWLFYVISGFVVTASLMHRPIGSRRRWIADFYTRRAARILPIYFLYVLIGMGVLTLLAQPLPWRAVASLFGFYNNFAMAGGYGDMPPWPVGHLWTISVEMQFYAVYGLAFALAPRRWLILGLAGLLVLAPLLRAIFGLQLAQQGVPPLNAAYHVYSSSVMQFDAFAAGALLAFFRERIAARRGDLILFGMGLAAMAVYAGAYVAINVIVRDRQGVEIIKDVISGIAFGEGRQIWLYSALALLNSGLLIWTVSGRAPWSGLMRHPLLRRVGEVSYGAYILHGLAIVGGQALLARIPGLEEDGVVGTLILFVGALALAVGMAEVSYRFLEKPIIAWSARRSKRRALDLGDKAG